MEDSLNRRLPQWQAKVNMKSSAPDFFVTLILEFIIIFGRTYTIRMAILYFKSISKSMGPVPLSKGLVLRVPVTLGPAHSIFQYIFLNFHHIELGPGVCSEARSRGVLHKLRKEGNFAPQQNNKLVEVFNPPPSTLTLKIIN